MSLGAPVLQRKAGNEQALFVLPESTMRQLDRPVKRMSPGWFNLWQIDGYYVGGMSSQERKQRRRFPFILPILSTDCFPSQDLLDSPLPGRKVPGSVGSQQLMPTSSAAAGLLGAPSPGLPSAGSPKAAIKIITDPPSLLAVLSSSRVTCSEPLPFECHQDNTWLLGIYDVTRASQLSQPKERNLR